MPLTRKQQLGAVEELVSGTYNSAAESTAANFKHLVLDPQLQFTPEQFQREFIRGSISSTEHVATIKPGNASFTIELAGDSANPQATPVAPDWSLFFKACGMREVSVDVAVLAGSGITNGPFRHGEVVNQAISGASGIVVGDVHDGNRNLYLRDVTGTPTGTASHTWTGATSAAVSAPSAFTANEGFAWFPFSEQTMAVAYDGATGTPFTVGELVTEDATTAWAGIVVEPVPPIGATGTLYVRLYSGTITDNDAFTGATSSAQALVDDDPVGTTTQGDHPSLSMALLQDGPFRALKGTRGTFTMSGTVGEPVLLAFEFTGLQGAHGDSGPVSGVTYDLHVPPLLLGACLYLGLDDDADQDARYQPRVRSFQIALNNTLARREDMCNAAGATDYVITARDPGGTVSIELDLDAAYDIQDALLNATTARLELEVGTIATGNSFFIQCPGLQFTATPNSDTDGLLITDATFRATGGTQANVGQTAGEDNEVIIIYDGKT